METSCARGGAGIRQNSVRTSPPSQFGKHRKGFRAYRTTPTFPDMNAVDVVLPCLDEAAALPGVLAAMPAGYRAIVVDNGSTDGSPAVAAAHGATVVHEP